MKSIIISIHPQWVAKILSGEKTIEVRKSAPKELPFKVYVYCVKDRRKNYFNLVNHYGQIMFAPKSWDNILNGKVVAEFVCDDKEPFKYQYDDYLPGYIYETFCLSDLHKNIFESACLTEEELAKYSQGKITYALRITELKVYDEPKELGEFGVFCKDFSRCENIACYKDTCRNGYIPITRPPQSWMYCEELD